ncbi:MAG: hypothetical protein HY951_00690 [Bacteroidia bacterium]|nr:hypothetical protein [Bacteroidia bacterium]
MNIIYNIASLINSVSILTEMLVSDFVIPRQTAERLVKDRYHPYIEALNDGIWVFIESPYVDKVYRDSYYNYFSSKLNHDKKDCIRISLFNSEIKFNDFRDNSTIDELKNKFLGFIVIRPTPPSIIGRSVITPEAFKKNSFKSRLINVKTTVNYVKMKVRGFPHSSQDTETITCAETTIWSCLEYFGTEYPEYKTILPSQITNVLSKVAFERQLPSIGLNVRQISSALKEFGFGSKIYSSRDYNGNMWPDFPVISSTYIESGIPLILILHKSQGAGHAVLCIGHENLEKTHFDQLNVPKTLNNIKVYDLDYIKKKFIIIDDNYPPYQSSYFDNPCQYYKNTVFHNYRIEYIVVPLYPKIYLDAFEAKNFVYDLISLSPWKMVDNSTVALRFYLASTRSFKDWLALKSNMQEDLREIILSIAMPKFIWITEVGTKDSFSQKPEKAKGIILLDATGANKKDLKPLIIAAYDDQLFFFDPITNEPQPPQQMPLTEFIIYQNLKN